MPQYVSIIIIAMLSIVVVFTVALLYRNARRTQISHRFALTMSNAYEEIYELNLSENKFYQYYIINSMFEKTAMLEPLEQYMQRVVREHVYQRDIQAVTEFTSMENLERLSRNNETQYIEYRRLSPKGVPYWCSIVAQGVSETKHRQAYVMYYICNVNEAKSKEEQAQERLVQALRNAEHLSEAKGNFTSRVSHEIRTPLNAIVGYLAICKQHSKEPERVVDCVQKAELASKHLLSIVNDILDVSAMESGRMRLDETAFKLRDFVGNVSTIYYEQAKEKGRAFTIRLKDITEENLIGDEMRIRQIMMNLVNNALKFTPEGGHVDVLIRQVAIVNDVVHLAIIVKDDGIGMKKEFLSHIFEAYEQEEAATARNYGGSGLGLSIVKHLCEMMGGNISVDSEVGKGSTFTVTLPIKRVSYKLPEGSQRKAISRLRVLLASNDRSNLEITTSLLKRIETAYDTTVSGVSALEMLERGLAEGKPYDLLIIDWDLSDRETALRRLAGFGDKRLSIAAISEQNASELDDEAYRYSVGTVIQKPLNHSVLIDMLIGIVMKIQNDDPEADEATSLLPDFTGRRVLLVEDNMLNREIGKELLKNVNAEVEVAENGRIAVDKFTASEQGHYELILMDIQMPVLDGYSATREIRAIADRPDAAEVPIIALTANAFPADVNQTIAAGMNAHVSKPIDPDQLYATMRQFL